MILSLKKNEISGYVRRQLDSMFPDSHATASIESCIDETLERLEKCFSEVAVESFRQGEKTLFNHLHSDQYAMFLYLLANTLYHNNKIRNLCDKIFFLNKALYGIDVFYEVELPSIFLFCHAGGTVLGRAQYSDYFLVYQQCTVGAARAAEKAGRGVFPVLGRHVSLYAGATVLGRCNIGDNCKISAQSVIVNKRLKANTMYRGTPQSYETVAFPFPDNIWK